MKFLLYSINHSPELTGIGKYNGELVTDLANRSIETHVITAPPYYPEWSVHKGYKNGWSKQKNEGVTVYRCPLYVPKRVTTLKRLIHLSSFAFSSGLRLFTLLRLKPDVLFLVQPTLF
ncbi:MAG: glycosyltransferase, partial [Colwellia sp.]